VAPTLKTALAAIQECSYKQHLTLAHLPALLLTLAIFLQRHACLVMPHVQPAAEAPIALASAAHKANICIKDHVVLLAHLDTLAIHKI